MRRPLLALTVSALLVVLPATGASAAVSGGWTHLGDGGAPGTASLNGAVYALNTDNPGILYVGGAFTDAGGKPAADYIAKWNGSTWSALASAQKLNGAVRAIAYHAGKVYAGGQFTNAGGHADADFLAVWDGSHWAPFCTSTGPDPSFGGSVSALQIIGSTLYVGGAFRDGADIDSADYLLACDLNTGAASSTVPNNEDINSGVYALTADSNGTLYAGGQFINLAGNPAADHVAFLSGDVWQAMGSGSPDGGAVNGYVRSITAHGTDVYVGTDATDVAGIPQADHVARWNGSEWSALGSNTAGSDGWFSASSAFINAMTTDGPLVFAAGSFQNANGVARADSVAYFDGSAWRPLGSDGAGNGPLPGNVTAIAVVNKQLVAGGSFTSAGGDTAAEYAAQYSIPRPDAQIGPDAAGPFLGNNVYSSTANGESKTISVPRGHVGTVFLKIQSDGLRNDTLEVKGTGSAQGFAVHYFSGSTNVTTEVLDGTFSTGSLAPGASTTLRMNVAVASSSASNGTFLVAARSSSGIPRDAVKAIVHAT
jgi:hypothetical protein